MQLKGQIRQLISRVAQGVLSILIIVHAAECSASDIKGNVVQDIVFAGFSFTGDNDLIKHKYPYTIPLQNRIDDRIRSLADQSRPKYFNLITNKLVDSDLGSSVSLSLALENERVIVERIGKLFQLEVSLIASAIVFKFTESGGEVIARYPLQISYVDTFSTKPNKNHIQEIVHKLYFGGLSSSDSEASEERAFGNLLGYFFELIDQTKIKEKYALRVGIGRIDLSERVRQGSLPKSYIEHPEILNDLLARRLGESLFYYHDVSVVPRKFEKNSGKMALRFTGEKSSRFFSLPEPDYLIDMSVRLLNEGVVRQAAEGPRKSFGSFIRFTVRYGYDDALQPIFSRNIIGSSQLSVAKTVEKDEWRQGYMKSMYQTIEDFVGNISKPSVEWRKVQELNKDELKKLKKVSGVLEKCR